MKMYLLPSDIQNFPSFTNTAYYDKPLIMTILPGPDVVILSGFHCTTVPYSMKCTVRDAYLDESVLNYSYLKIVHEGETYHKL